MRRAPLGTASDQFPGLAHERVHGAGFLFMTGGAPHVAIFVAILACLDTGTDHAFCVGAFCLNDGLLYGGTWKGPRAGGGAVRLFELHIDR